MSLFLVRHASARARSRWDGDDLDRPLDARGRDQVPGITEFFVDRPVRGVWSSRAVRCIDTVQGVADAFGLAVEPHRELTEGAKPKTMLAAIHEQATEPGDLVMCSHGDLIPEVLNRLLRAGLRVKGPRGCEKGSIWELRVVEGEIARGIYTAAP